VTARPATTDVRRGSDFADLCREVRAADLLGRKPLHYAMRAACTVSLLLGICYLFARLGASWYQLLVAAGLGVAFTQIAFLGHDAGHQQVFSARRANDLMGLVVGNLVIGMSYGWWVEEHTRHHIYPNYEDKDPDIGEGVLAFTAEQARTRSGPVTRFIARHQAALFFPLLTLEGLNLRVLSAQALLAPRGRRRRRVEVVFILMHVIGYLTAVFLVLPVGMALAFVAVHQAVFGVYMGCSFAPNHKGMPTVAPGEKVDFLRRQVLTARNVRGGRITDFMLGGLNYQVEHHLFPSMPRPNLRHVQPIVRAHCQALNIPYTEASLIGSYAAALRYLHAVGEPLRQQARTRS